MTAQILIVDDDPHIRDVIRIAVSGAGLTSIEAANGQIALTHLGRETVDLVVLDIGMPYMDGFECCKAIRAHSDVPILFLTAQDEEIDRVLGFQLGADDFVPKPFSPRELVLRIKAILGRGRAQQKTVGHGAVSLDPDAHVCTINGSDMVLTATEFTVLKLLLTKPQNVHDRQQLINSIYGGNSAMSGRTIDSHIRNIRAKAANLGCYDIIATVYGVGVRLGACTT